MSSNVTNAEIYEFDLNGYILYRNLIDADDLRRMNDIVGADLGDRNSDRLGARYRKALA